MNALNTSPVARRIAASCTISGSPGTPLPRRCAFASPAIATNPGHNASRSGMLPTCHHGSPGRCRRRGGSVRAAIPASCRSTIRSNALSNGSKRPSSPSIAANTSTTASTVATQCAAGSRRIR